MHRGQAEAQRRCGKASHRRPSSDGICSRLRAAGRWSCPSPACHHQPEGTAHQEGQMKKLLPVALSVALLALGGLNLALPGASASSAATRFTVVKSSVNVTGSGLNWNTDALCPSG